MNEIEALRERSGTVTSNDRLVSFLYILMRDHVTPGIVEEIVLKHITEDTAVFTNGWLAKYAEDVAERVRFMNVPKIFGEETK